MTPTDDRLAETSVPVHPLLGGRWSPRGFDTAHALTREDLLPLLEAARWSPSAGNTHPWRFVVSLRGEPAHTRLVAALNPGNRTWAVRAAALVVAVALREDADGKPYPSARHDVGQAVAHLSLQAAADGLYVHQMAGFDRDALRAAVGLTEVQEPAVVIAVGALGGEALPEQLAARESAPRTRLPLEELVLPVE